MIVHDSKPLKDSNYWVHSFLKKDTCIKVTPTKTVGVCSFKVSDKTHVMVGDYVIKWSESGGNKVIYRVVQSQTSVAGFSGMIRDMVALDEVTEEAKSAIIMGDPDATLVEEEEECWENYIG